MKTCLLLIALLMLFSCNEKEKTVEKNPTRAECEGIQDEKECTKAGCLYSCGISLTGPDGCMGRKRAGICVAVERYEGMKNNTDYYLFSPQSKKWACRMLRTDPQALNVYQECFEVHNTRKYPIRILGIDVRLETPSLDDPCLADPNEADYPFEGSCEELLWSRTLWEDILGEYNARYDNW